MTAENATDSTPIRPRGRPRWATRFLAGLQEHGTVKGACQQVGISRAAAYRLRNDDQSFAREWDEACESGANAAEKSLVSRSIRAWLEPIHEAPGWRLLDSRRWVNDQVGADDDIQTRGMAERIFKALEDVRRSVPFFPQAKPDESA